MQINTGTPLLAPQQAKTAGQPAQPQQPAAPFEPVEFPAANAPLPERTATDSATLPQRPLPPGSRIDIRI